MGTPISSAASSVANTVGPLALYKAFSPTQSTAAPRKPVDPLQPPDQLDQMLRARQAALRTLAAKRGMQSTFVTGAQPGALGGGPPGALGGGYGGAP